MLDDEISTVARIIRYYAPKLVKIIDDHERQPLRMPKICRLSTTQSLTQYL